MNVNTSSSSKLGSMALPSPSMALIAASMRARSARNWVSICWVSMPDRLPHRNLRLPPRRVPSLGQDVTLTFYQHALMQHRRAIAVYLYGGNQIERSWGRGIEEFYFGILVQVGEDAS